MELPDRKQDAEDAFVAQWLDGQGDDDQLIVAVEEAMTQRRPRLAARLVQLLSDGVEIEPGTPLARAERAATMLLLQQKPEDRSFSELEEAWGELRKRRMHRIRHRMRRALAGKESRLNRLGKPRRR